MNHNENQLASIVQNVYGTSAHDTFTQLWTQHMDEYQNYTLARKNKDTAKMNTAKQNLESIANKLGTLFGNASKNISASTLSSSMMEHINSTLAIVDAVSQKNTTQAANSIKASYDQAGNFADVIARGMILDTSSCF